MSPQEVYDKILRFSQGVETCLLDDVVVREDNGEGCLHITYCRELALVVVDTMAPVSTLAGPPVVIWDAFYEAIEVERRHLLARDVAHEVLRHFLWHLDRHPEFEWAECRLDGLH